MNNVKKVSGIALAMTAASLLGCTSSPETKSTQTVLLEQCYGIHKCAGKNDCKTLNNACKGHSECKGRGYIALTKAECEAAGGHLRYKYTGWETNVKYRMPNIE